MISKEINSTIIDNLLPSTIFDSFKYRVNETSVSQLAGLWSIEANFRKTFAQKIKQMIQKIRLVFIT